MIVRSYSLFITLILCTTVYFKGVRGLYRGLVPHMWRDGPGYGVYMLIYEGYGVFTLIAPHSDAELLHCKKRLSFFPAPAGMSLTKLSLDEKLLNYPRPGKVWLVSSRLGTGKTIPFFTVYLLPHILVLKIVCKSDMLFLCYFYFIEKIFLHVRGKVNQRQSSFNFKKSNQKGQKESVNATSHSY
jgi:hypothetical protein